MDIHVGLPQLHSLAQTRLTPITPLVPTPVDYSPLVPNPSPPSFAHSVAYHPSAIHLSHLSLGLSLLDFCSTLGLITLAPPLVPLICLPSARSVFILATHLDCSPLDASPLGPLHTPPPPPPPRPPPPPPR